jgi:hypothetical protein
VPDGACWVAHRLEVPRQLEVRRLEVDAVVPLRHRERLAVPGLGLGVCGSGREHLAVSLLSRS